MTVDQAGYRRGTSSILNRGQQAFRRPLSSQVKQRVAYGAPLIYGLCRGAERDATACLASTTGICLRAQRRDDGSFRISDLQLHHLTCRRAIVMVQSSASRPCDRRKPRPSRHDGIYGLVTKYRRWPIIVRQIRGRPLQRTRRNWSSSYSIEMKRGAETSSLTPDLASLGEHTPTRFGFTEARGFPTLVNYWSPPLHQAVHPRIPACEIQRFPSVSTASTETPDSKLGRLFNNVPRLNPLIRQPALLHFPTGPNRGRC